MLKDHLGDFSCENHLVVSFTKITGELALVLSKNKNKISHLHGPVKFLIFFFEQDQSPATGQKTFQFN